MITRTFLIRMISKTLISRTLIRMSLQGSVDDDDDTFGHFFRCALIYHLAKESALRRANTVANGLGSAILPPYTPANALPNNDRPDLTRQAADVGRKQCEVSFSFYIFNQSTNCYQLKTFAHSMSSPTHTKVNFINYCLSSHLPWCFAIYITLSLKP